MSRVYRAVRSGTGENCAVKVIRIEDVAADYERRLRREPEVQQGIGHENIVALVDWFRDRDEFFLVMEYVAGRSLAQIIHQESGPLPFPRARGYFEQALRGVQHLHLLGIIHRDIKPSNLLVTWDDRVKLADFGIAKFVWQQGETRTQKGVGTPEYMSPEQARGGDIDLRTDIYSLGITFFEMLTGRKPFSRLEQTPMAYVEVIQGVLNEPLPDPRAFQPGLSPMVVRLLNKATAKDPNDRFQTIAQFIGALEMVEAVPDSTPTVVPGADPRPTPPSSVSPTVAGSADSQREKKVRSAPVWIVLLTILIAAGGYYGYRWYRTTMEASAPLTDLRATEIVGHIAEDYREFAIRQIPSALASLYGESGVEYFRLKKATRQAIEEDGQKFYDRIVQTDTFTVDVKSVRVLNDSTIQSEWWISYDRLKDDGTRLRGMTSNLLTFRSFGGEWQISRQVQKWINRQNVPPPVVDTLPVAPDTLPHEPEMISDGPQVKDLKPSADSLVTPQKKPEEQGKGGGIFNSNEPQEARVRRTPVDQGKGNVERKP